MLGSTYQQPYFWAISQDKDFTFSPIFTTKRSVVGIGRYREVFPTGAIDLRASLTHTDRERRDGTIENDVFRGHIDSTARFDINDSNRMGVDVQRATDDTYMRLHNLSTAQDSTSRAFIEGPNGRNYLAGHNYL